MTKIDPNIIRQAVSTALCDCNFGYPYASEDCTHRPLISKITDKIVQELSKRPIELDWDGILKAIKGSKNTLAGWLRNMDGYGDSEMKTALSSAWKRPDPRIKPLQTYRRMVESLEQELIAEGINVSEI